MKRNKDIFRILLALLAVMFFWCGAAAAIDVTTPRNLSAGAVTGKVGDTVSVPIMIDNAAGIGGVAFTIGYDALALEFKGVTQDLKVIADGSKEGGYTVDETKANLFYQVNDEKVDNVSVGRVMVAAATAEGLTGSSMTLLKANFLVKAGAGGTYYVELMKTIISNAAAGYTQPQPIPVFVEATEKNAEGKYTSTTFREIAAMLKRGSIGVTIVGKAISGKAYYGANTSLPASGCAVILKKTAMGMPGTFVWDSQTTVGATGTFSFPNKPTGNYQVFVESRDPGYLGSGMINVLVETADVPMTDVHLAAAAATFERKTGLVTPFTPGMQLQVFRVETSGDVPLGMFPVAQNGSWATGLLEIGKTYKYYIVYGSQKQEVQPGTTPTTLAWTLQKIKGTITGLPTDAFVTIMVGSETAKVQKMVRKKISDVPVGGYEFTDLVQANDYIVSMAGAGKPLTYYNMVNDITLATKVDISSTDQTAVNFDFGTTDTTGKIAGKVVEGASNVSGMAIYAFETGTYALTQAVTAADGAYEFKLVPGSYQLFVIKENGKIFYYNATAATQSETAATVITVATGDNLTGKNIDIAECTNSLEGYVTIKSEGGYPVANILVTVFSEGKPSRAVAMTQQDGSYTLTGLCGPATYNVVMQPLMGRYAVQKKTVSIPTSDKLNFVIDSGRVLSGTVKDDVGEGTNVNNAMIYLLDQETGTLLNNRMYFSAAGKYEIGEVASGVYTLQGSHPDYPAYTKPNLGISADKAQNILFTKGARFTGTVTATSGGAKIAGALVIVTRAGGMPISVVTNTDGKYDVYGLDASKTDYMIMVQKKEYLRKIVKDQTPATGTGAVVNITIDKPATTFDLSGTVSKSGGAGAVMNAWVMLTATVSGETFFISAMTNGSGVYSFTKLPQAAYRLAVIPGGSLPAYSETGSGTDWSASTGTVTKNVEIAWGTATNISGTVTRTGSGVISVFLYKASDRTFVAFAKAGDNGAYEFQGLVTTDTYKILAISQGNKPGWYGGATLDSATATAVGTTTANITLVAE
ncbi:MAG: cohesin domain-containing protein [Deltaproteobacteria bacterium]